MSAGRAKKGGQIAMNGEFYKGGTFLPNTQLPKRGARARGSYSPRKVLVEPGVFATMLGEGGSIFGKLQLFVDHDDNNTLVARFGADHPAIAAYFQSYEQYLDLIARYNSGERFF